MLHEHQKVVPVVYLSHLKLFYEGISSHPSHEKNKKKKTEQIFYSANDEDNHIMGFTFKYIKKEDSFEYEN